MRQEGSGGSELLRGAALPSRDGSALPVPCWGLGGTRTPSQRLAGLSAGACARGQLAGWAHQLHWADAD